MIDETRGDILRARNATRPRPGLEPGDRVTTRFYESEAVRVRVVESVTPAPIHCQTGWWVVTRCGLSCDAGWFRKA